MSNTFDPNAASSADSGLFGLPHRYEDAALVLLPVPWEATTSYGAGTSNGPSAILEASRQVDLFDIDVLRPYEAGLFLLPESDALRQNARDAKAKAARIIAKGGDIGDDSELQTCLTEVNAACNAMNQFVQAEVRRLLADGKIPALIGGDHSTPFGALQAMAEAHTSFGILQIDAHSDTRKAYEGFTWSHASITYNILESIPQVSKLVQVGIRDFCEEEHDYLEGQAARVSVFWDSQLAEQKMEGESWGNLAQDIVATLPQDLWITFDIDGLDPRYCPHTGTPVPGGLDFNEANHLLRTLVRSGRRILGFDLNEVSPHPQGNDEWDANVGARLLYKLSAWTLASHKRAQVRTPASWA